MSVIKTKTVARWLVYLVAVLALVATFAPAYAQQNTAQVDKAVGYIRGQQQPDGSFAGFGPGSTADAILALAAANQNIAEIKQGSGASPVEYIRSQASTTASDAGVSAKFLIAALVAGQSPTFEGVDLAVNVEQSYNQQTAQYGKDVTTHAYSLIGLVAAGRTPKAEAVEALKKLQLPDGGWSFDGTAATGSDTNTTSLAVQALKATGDTSDAISKAIAYYKTQQNGDGGFPYSQSSQFGNASDANSTALSIQALIAAGESLQNWSRGSQNPAQRLAAFQNESGAFRYQDTQPEDNALATYQAVPALVGKTLPLEGIVIAFPDVPSASPDPSASASPAPSTSPDPSASEAPSATPAPVPAPSTPPSGGVPVPVQLPNTGVQDWMPAAALIGALLLLSGLAVNRRRA
ncbi:MAG TPA: prenyltransferase/squalene oxidase repeat-containing protein [Herpetosiphonaceae bacterium]